MNESFFWERPRNTITVESSEGSVTLVVADLSLASMDKMDELSKQMKDHAKDGTMMLKLIREQLDTLFPEGWEEIEDMPIQYLTKLIGKASEIATNVDDDTKKKPSVKPLRASRSRRS